MIRPDDRERMRRELTEQINRGGEYEVEYRVEDRSGRSIWMLDKGRLMYDNEGREYFYSVIIDIDQTKHAQEELRLGLERYKIVMEQTNDIFFEWDIGSDTVVYSTNWRPSSDMTPSRSRHRYGYLRYPICIRRIWRRSDILSKRYGTEGGMASWSSGCLIPRAAISGAS